MDQAAHLMDAVALGMVLYCLVTVIILSLLKAGGWGLKCFMWLMNDVDVHTRQNVLYVSGIKYIDQFEEETYTGI